MASSQFESVTTNQPLADDGQEKMDFLGFLRRRKSFIILLGLLGVGVGYLIFKKQDPVFRSTTRVQVIHQSSDPRLQTMLAEKDLSDADYVIKSPKVIGAAVISGQLNDLRTLKGLNHDSAVSRINSMLSVRTLSAAVLEISCTGQDPSDIRKIADAVAAEYLKLQQASYEDASVHLQKLLSEALDEIHEDLKRAEAAHTEFRRNSKLSVTGENLHAQREADIQQKLSGLELEIAQLRSQLSAIEEAMANGGSREAILLLVEKQSAGTNTTKTQVAAVENTSESARTMAEALFPLLKEEALLAADFGADHPRLKSVRLQIEMTRKHLQELAGMDPLPVVPGEEVKPPEDILTVYLQSLRQELQIYEKQQTDLRAMAQREEDLARSLAQEMVDDRNKQAEIDRLSKLFEGVTLQINELKVNAGMGGVMATVLAPAQDGTLAYPILESFLGLGGFLGAFVGLVIGYLVEMADRSFRKPEDIIREFGVPIMGHVPFIKESRLKSVPKDAAFDRTAITVHLPRSRPAEAYRAVRTAVCFSPAGSDHRLIQVTSPAAGDGKSTLALNLAISMAQSGKKTILVESDFRRPKVHRLTDVSNDVGFVDVLRGDVELDDAIQTTSVKDFFVLPCGSRPNNPSELLSRPEYEQLLLVLREKFDVVIIDTPPVLAVTDPCSVAPRVDAVIVCMRLSRHTRELGRRTLEQLRDVGGRIVGVVINGVDERDTYGYGNYRYSDYNSYRGYGYTDDVAGGAHDGYFSDERTSEKTPARS